MVVDMHCSIVRDISCGLHRLLYLLGLIPFQMLLAVSDVQTANAARHKPAMVGLSVEVYGCDG